LSPLQDNPNPNYKYKSKNKNKYKIKTSLDKIESREVAEPQSPNRKTIMVKAYCVKCKKTTEQKDSKKIVNGNRARMSGKCADCNNTTSVFVKKDDADAK
jgi:ribosomal protein S27E